MTAAWWALSCSGAIHSMEIPAPSRLPGGPKVLTVSPHSEPRARRPTAHHTGEAGKVESNAREIHCATCWSHEVGPKWSLCPATASQVLFCLKPNCSGQALGLPA